MRQTIRIVPRMLFVNVFDRDKSSLSYGYLSGDKGFFAAVRIKDNKSAVVVYIKGASRTRRKLVFR